MTDDKRSLIANTSLETQASVYMASGLPPVTPQELVLKLIELSRFNQFDGPTIARDLMKHRELWDAALLHGDPPGLTLRDLDSNYYNADTLVLLTSVERYEALKTVVTEWMADTLSVYDAKGLQTGSRYESSDCKSFTLQPAGDETVRDFLMSSLGDRPDHRIVIQLWWD